MRNISEQELKDILDKHGKWLRNEDGGERADLCYADLCYADLCYADLCYANLTGANLSYANLTGADLSGANLRGVDLRGSDLRGSDLSGANLTGANLSYANLAVFQFQRHQAFYTLDGILRIGCHVMPISEWLLGFEEIGKHERYSEIEIQMYGNFIKSCEQLFKRETSK